MSDWLPMRIIIEILARLPVKAIGRCRCVCKQWCSMIAEPFFIKKQLHLSHSRSCSFNDDNSSSSLVVTQSEFRETRVYCNSLRCYSEALVEYKRLKTPPHVNQKNYFRLEGSSNGLVCLLYHGSFHLGDSVDIVLWNPSINKLKILPDSRYRNMHHASHCNVILGFAFVPRISDYKLVRLTYKICIRVFPMVEVYTLSTDSWRTIMTGDGDGLLCKLNEESPGPLLNGVVHWMAYRVSEIKKQEFLIMSFHMDVEKFEEVPLPAFTGALGAISACQGSLALFVRTSMNHGSRDDWDIWLMKDYGVVDSWTKQYNLRDLIGTPLVLLKNGDFILKGCFGLFFYDPKNKELRSRLERIPTSPAAVFYEESIALLNEGVDIQSN